MVFNAGDKQTVDVSIGSNVAWYCNGETSSGKYNVTPFGVDNLVFYLYDYDSTFSNPTAHVWKNNGPNMDTWPGTALTAETNSSGRIYKVVTDEMADRVIFSDNGSNQTSNLTIKSNQAYKLNESVWWDNMNYVKAHDWAMNLMHMRDYDTSLSGEGTGLCSTYYPTAKSIYDTFDSGVILEINNGFASAVARFNTWAEIVGSNSSSGSNIMNDSEKNNLGITAIVIASFALLSSCAFFVFKKRKHQ